ncbi:hypothetical protein W97_05159 [Coniosporium apollinis CBS 100218]|uniref:Uncharacterized protein n=1 Tax=Coniosporium apollinis (strain CBS 100218) TaxID=1168221 RepID=R7YVI7_CONA1|nr:uncharacterized protein W97_05159 [Coniosporium apollinis CBS 100218]EON65917.1 hypothetical protein W97_05159 [Coniosporium apollinis CBS 100218]
MNCNALKEYGIGGFVYHVKGDPMPVMKATDLEKLPGSTPDADEQQLASTAWLKHRSGKYTCQEEELVRDGDWTSLASIDIIYRSALRDFVEEGRIMGQRHAENTPRHRQGTWVKVPCQIRHSSDDASWDRSPAVFITTINDLTEAVLDGA